MKIPLPPLWLRKVLYIALCLPGFVPWLVLSCLGLMLGIGVLGLLGLLGIVLALVVWPVNNPPYRRWCTFLLGCGIVGMGGMLCVSYQHLLVFEVNLAWMGMGIFLAGIAMLIEINLSCLTHKK